MLTTNVTSRGLCAKCLLDVNLEETLSPQQLEQYYALHRANQSFYLTVHVAVVPRAHCQNCQTKLPPPVADETDLHASALQVDSVPEYDLRHLSPIVFLAGNLERDRQFHQT